jgi:hypothetical protein
LAGIISFAGRFCNVKHTRLQSASRLFSDDDVEKLVRLRLANDHQVIEALLREKKRFMEYGASDL